MIPDTQTLTPPTGMTQPEEVRSIRNNIAWNLFLISAGSVICAWAVNAILLPNHFLSGGMTGLSLICHYLHPGIELGIYNFFLNIPLYVLGWYFLGRRFLLYSIAGLVIYSAAVIVIKGTCPIQDRILAALFAGIVNGVGCGIILKSVGSAGGTDILGIILMKRFSIRLGTTVLAFNATIMVASVFIFNLESVLYTLIFMYVNARIVDLMVTGLSQRKAVMIISRKWQELSRIIMKDINRGVTMIPAFGGYSGQNENVLYTVVTFRELSRLKEHIRRVDDSPFVVVSDTMEVIGQRIGNQPHW